MVAQSPAPASLPEPLRFQYMGPASAGRISAVAGIPGDNDVAATHLNVGGIKLPLNTSCNPPAAAAIDIVMYDSAGNPIAFQEYFLP